ncbi:MAG: hypothetical protein A3G33_00945 [Omnitrophica bacterium RIFCSPLOWO2_12_FULL_44_17]|uniref:DUF4186 domain-containing protein n=1 Tax=Candidatus Danuiimicrobium aquiferis TaxID=1801832 RepID=A0A1G1L2T9_9BACT|nr:MAG: hypothetical protein A3B72_06495 [Omnitrophica bacterium RIFCSPHIGHO2_02_FULL_45_28]OGW89661.1 MAG: hypothetical protein A3E74_04685 [Omnitrophica bacterium RIFCSPHIGHO2_12_FULL_44_12]OGW99471.1 MAG: hypothetical protein A3G33_00945 [Omnitrophica bacterium RIFCSPLOWO2_12_FULL_44_17]OGX04307.1 MAG: hypothetical protein A3J12_00655 [Omnitrophica bacterium RIFCSPLOWO2_02_FULL_44_11]
MFTTAQERKNALSKSKFRSRFFLSPEDIEYIKKASWPVIRSHAYDFIAQRVAPKHPENDGRQTPYAGHPVFKAQHATATCCRGCLAKWYGIPKGRMLTRGEVDMVVVAIVEWLEEHVGKNKVLPEKKSENQVPELQATFW